MGLIFGFIVFCFVCCLFFAFLYTLIQGGEWIDETIGIEGGGFFSFVVLTFFIIPFMLTVLLWSGGFFKNAFELENPGGGLFLVLLPFWVIIGLLCLPGTVQKLREGWEKAKREWKENVKRLRAVRQRIQNRGYPLPDYVPPTWETDNLNAYRIEVALKEYEDYEKHMNNERAER